VQKLELAQELQLDYFGASKYFASVQWMAEPECSYCSSNKPRRVRTDAATQLTVQELLQEREITIATCYGVPEVARSESAEDGVPGVSRT